MSHPAERAALLASADDAEALFYEALQTGDIERLMAVWADDEECVCVHPGGPRVVGPQAIRASFEAVFANGGIPVQPQQVHRLHSLDAAVHHLAERISLNTSDGLQTAWVLATNVFVKTAQGWRIVAHHASPGTLDAPGIAPAVAGILH
jgi:uncharacterized protein (TIGR02246 family)